MKMASKPLNQERLAEESEICGSDAAEERHIESRFECPICLAWLKDPMLTSCGHKFCAQCISAWLGKPGSCCPVDGKQLDPDKDLFEDRYTRREISQQRAVCPYRRSGCDLELSPVEMEKHVEEAHSLLCQFKDFGCTLHFRSEDALRAHMESSVNDHLTMTAKALAKLNVAQSETNSRALESKLWDPPAKNGAEGCKDEEVTPDLQQLFKNLYERIVILEQQNRELSITVANQRTKLTALQSWNRSKEEEMILRNCNGVYIWRLNNFAKRLEEMRLDPLKMFYSPGFYTSPNGYKICARLNLSPKDRNCLSILLHMMRSENDDALDWPFDGSISFVLVHSQWTEKSIREKTTSRPDLGAFRRPMAELNKRSFGYTEFVDVRDLTEFITNDSVVFRIEVRPRDSLPDNTFSTLSQFD